MSLDRSSLTLAVDVMGGDHGPSAVVKGCKLAIDQGLRAKLVLVGREDEIANARATTDLPGERLSVIHAEGVVEMDDKPAKALRQSRNSSMWAAIEEVKEKRADGVVSCGNTGALMAIARMRLKMIEGVDRPAASALWPTKTGKAVVLDVGANIDVTAEQLVQFAIMGEAFYRAMTEKERPRVGLLNIGEEDLKGNALIKHAAKVLREADPEMDFIGFVEGNDISSGEVDVVVTDGFTGNVALKTAEGTARLLGGWLKEALTDNLMSKMGAALMMPALKKLKARMDPASVNGAPLLGLAGLVVKSHGGAEPEGIASALLLAEELAAHPFLDKIEKTVADVSEQAEDLPLEEEDQPSSAAAE
jgi:glycerol-3-phosphate acyltransferase PlsX